MAGGVTNERIIDLIKTGTPEAQIMDLVRKEGLAFTPSGASQMAIRDAGGDLALTGFLSQFSKDHGVNPAPGAGVASNGNVEASRPSSQEWNGSGPNSTQGAPAGRFGWVLGLDAEFGGDEVAKLYFTDNSTQSVNAGQGVTLDVGGHYRPYQSALDFVGTVGYKYVTTKASNATITLTRTVFEFRADYWLNRDVWIGAGPVMHTGIKLNSGGFAQNLGFDNATGVTAKFGWNLLALSYTAMKYKDEFGTTYSANNFGLSLVARF